MAATVAPSTALQPATQDPLSTALKQTMAPADVHVLLVDDERLSRVVVGNVLRKCNYRGEASCRNILRSLCNLLTKPACPAAMATARAVCSHPSEHKERLHPPLVARCHHLQAFQTVMSWRSERKFTLVNAARR